MFLHRVVLRKLIQHPTARNDYIWMYCGPEHLQVQGSAKQCLVIENRVGCYNVPFYHMTIALQR